MKTEYVNRITDLLGRIQPGLSKTHELSFKSCFGAVAGYVDGNIFISCGRFGTLQLRLNLASNAVRYTPSGVITLSTRRRAAQVGAVVRDTGIGIAAENRDHIFDRFYRVDPSRARALGGAGLGLTIAKVLAELQGGAIDVVSELGSGSTFGVWLPEADLGLIRTSDSR